MAASPGLRVVEDGASARSAAKLVLAADGRRSLVREAAALPLEDLGAPMDVFWFRLSKARTPRQPVDRRDRHRPAARPARPRRLLAVRLCLPEGDRPRRSGRGASRIFARTSPGPRRSSAGSVGELASWDQVKLLTVALDRLTRWHRPGPARDRRRRARHVADRRRRHQPGDPGRGRGGEHPRRADGRGEGSGRPAGTGPAAADAADPDHPGRAARRPEPRHRPHRPAQRPDHAAAAADPADAAFPDPAAHSGAPRRPRLQARACPFAGRGPGLSECSRTSGARWPSARGPAGKRPNARRSCHSRAAGCRRSRRRDPRHSAGRGHGPRRGRRRR